MWPLISTCVWGGICTALMHAAPVWLHGNCISAHMAQLARQERAGVACSMGCSAAAAPVCGRGVLPCGRTRTPSVRVRGVGLTGLRAEMYRFQNAIGSSVRASTTSISITESCCIQEACRRVSAMTLAKHAATGLLWLGCCPKQAVRNASPSPARDLPSGGPCPLERTCNPYTSAPVSLLMVSDDPRATQH